MFINVKMPTIVDILTFISKIKTTSDRLKARTNFIFHHFTFYEQLKFHTRLRLSMKKVFLTSGPGSNLIKLVLCSNSNEHGISTAMLNYESTKEMFALL